MLVFLAVQMPKPGATLPDTDYMLRLLLSTRSCWDVTPSLLLGTQLLF